MGSSSTVGGLTAAVLAVVGAVALAGSAELSATATATASARTAAATLWVSRAPVAPARSGQEPGAGTSCTRPGYNTIQAAIDAAPAGGSIEVCAGTYAQQLQITRSVSITGLGHVTVQLPSRPADSSTSCDAAINAAYPGTLDQDGIVVCGRVRVTLARLDVHAAWTAGTCSDSLYALLVAGGASVEFDDSSVTAAGASPVNGCQGGVGIQAGMTGTSPAQVGHLFVLDSDLSGYQKNGITIDGPGSTGDISGAIVTGAGPTTLLAQNGIQVSNGASAQIAASRVTGDECDKAGCGADDLMQAQAAGVLLYGAGLHTTVADSTLSGDDMGVYYSADLDGPPPTGPTAVLEDDTFTADRYESVVLDRGSALVTGSVLAGGRVGVQALQYAGQAFGISSAVVGSRIDRMSVAAVQVLSDGRAGDYGGTLLVARCQIGPATVLDNSANIDLEERDDS
jgi:hypothetical protein